MPDGGATLHMLCGKIAAGKSTLARRLADAPGTVLVGEDALLSRLFPGEIRSLEDYARCVARLREALGPHLQELLGKGISVVLDFQANTPQARAWMRSVFEGAGAGHVLHFLDVPDEECRRRLRARNAAGAHEYRVGEADFDRFTSRFVAPADDEGFVVVRHG
jgi:predicted kinase